MKIIISQLIFLLSASSLKSQINDYSIGLTIGSGMNIYSNTKNTDAHHFKFKKGFSGFVGIKALKNLDENNSFVAELNYGRKKIEFEYQLNENAIPYYLKEINAQKIHLLGFCNRL